MAIIKEDNGDARADASTQYTIALGDVFEGTLDTAGDNDFIRVELSAGANYDVRITGIPSVEIDIANSEGSYGKSGYYQASADKFIFSMAHSIIYYIRIGSSDLDFTGDYELSIVDNTPSVATYEEITDYLTGNYYSGYYSRRIKIPGIEPGGILTANITALDEAGQQLAHWALEAWAMVMGVGLQIVDREDADITFKHVNLDRGAFAFATYGSDGLITSASVHVPAEWAAIYGDTIGTYTFYVYLHEIGHTLGLRHPGPYGTTRAPDDKIFGNDSFQTTVMSYFSQTRDNIVDASFAYPVTPMLADIIAIHDLYGTPVDVNPGDTVYGYGSNVEGYVAELFERWTGQEDSSFGNPVTLTLYDSGGIDTLDLSTDSSNQRVDLRPEGISDVYGLVGNLIIARDTLIENFIAGSGDDVVIGNDEANYLQGRGGNDELHGNGGNDVLEGGAGADRLDGGAGMDWASYQDSNSAVKVNLAERTLTGGTAEGDVIISIENVVGSDYADVLEGDSGANWLSGGSGNDDISGNNGNDILEGGPGADRLTGGAGGDTASYEHSNAGVTVRLHSGEVRGGDAEGDTFGAMVTVEYIGRNGDTQQETVPDIENLRGSVHADTLAGDSRANRLEGGNGNDNLYGGPGGGDDVLWGGPGEDALFGGIGDDILNGGADADMLKGGPGADTASYAQSDAGVTVRLHDGTVLGGHAEGDDIADIENVRGSAHADILEGDEGANRLDGAGGADELRGNGGDDVLEGGSGDDILEGGAGSDRLDGGTGVDWLSYARSDGPVSVRLYDGYAARGHAEGDTISGFENLRGSGYPDALSGSGRANRLAGGAGADQMWGGSGDDILDGGAGPDRLHGGPGTDTVVYEDSDAGVTVNLEDGVGTGGHAEGDLVTGVENISGSAYDDVLTGNGDANELIGGDGDDELLGNAGNDRLEGGAGIDRLDGGLGMDTVIYRNSDAAISVNLSDGALMGGHAEGDAIANIESVVGSSHGDHLVGDDGANFLDGHGGDDVLEGGGGADRLDGGAGMDTLVYRNSNEAVTVNLRNGALAGGHAEGDVIIDFENIKGSNYDDKLTGDSGANRLAGGQGSDELQGGYGNDELYGNDGDDLLDGGEGIDFLDGGAGVDTVSFSETKRGLDISLEHNVRYDADRYGGNRETIINIENVIGSVYADLIEGDSYANQLYGSEGNDRLDGRAGDDSLFGEAGDDRLSGLTGADLLDGGPGTDTVTYSASSEGVTVKLGEGIIEGGDADGDVLVSIENVEGSIHDDVLEGDNGANRISGGPGNDLLTGGGDADEFVFGKLADRLYYFTDHDNDTSADNDIILDFTDNEDLIDLTFYGLSGFDELTVSSAENGVIIDLSDYDGGTITLDGFDINNLDASDFLF